MNTKQMRPGDLEQTFLIDESANGERTRGGPPPLQSKTNPNLFFCPECRQSIYEPGYGLAYGGMGIYYVCDTEGCDWFYKIMDSDGE